MTRRHGVYLGSAIAVGGLLLELGWFALDPKGDARQHLIDRTIRAIDAAPSLVARLRAVARF